VSVQEFTLDQLGTVARGRSRHRPRDAAFLYGGPYPFIQTGDVKKADLYLRDYDQTYSEAGLAQSKLWPAGTLCITIAANIAETAILDIDACFPDSVIGFTADPQRADSRFVKYLFDAVLKTRFRSFTQGAAQDNLSQEKLLSIKFPVPELRVQKKIADILSAHSNLIENNRKRIALLEEAARLLYREWFVHLRFPGHEHSKIADGLPAGWQRRPLGEVASIRKGRNITRDTVQRGDIPVVAGGLKPAYFHSIANALGPVITVSASGANAGHVAVYHTDIWASDCSYLSASDNKRLWFLYLSMKARQSEITGMQQGAAQPHVYPKDLERLSILEPPAVLGAQFDETVADAFRLIGVLERQCDALARARDLLLPRLINGQMVV
jgi:type I restriction enzyme S subunit